MVLKKSNFAFLCLFTLTLVSGMFVAHASETPNKTSQPAATEKTEKTTTEKAVIEKTTKTEKSAKININTATVKMLKTLKGIGEKKAQDIVNYRQKHGKFELLEDLKKVPGIGDKTLEKNRHQITIGQPVQKTQKTQPKANNSPATEKSPKKPATTDKSGKSEKPGKNKAPANNSPDKKAASSPSKNQKPAQQTPKVRPL